jgi:hypothetical protein
MLKIIILCLVSLNASAKIDLLKFTTTGVSTEKFDSFAAEVLPSAIKKLHRSLNSNDCSLPYLSNAERYVLDQKKNISLYIVPCNAGAYQISYRTYLYQPLKSPDAVSLSALAYQDDKSRIVSSNEFMDVVFDSVEMTLLSTTRYRGIGDCGQASLSQFILLQNSQIELKTLVVVAKPKCNGVQDEWPIVYLANGLR